MKTLKTESLVMDLLEATARSRFLILKELWKLPETERPINAKEFHDASKDMVSRSLTDIREEINQMLISRGIYDSFPLFRTILPEDTPTVKRNILFMAAGGFSAECIADLNCVSKGYVKMTTDILRKDYPELFR